MFSSLRCFLLCTFLCLPFCEAITERECRDHGGKVCEEIEGGCFFKLKPAADYKTAVDDCKNTHGSSLLDHDNYAEDILFACLVELSLTDRTTTEVWDASAGSECESVKYKYHAVGFITEFTVKKDKDCSAKLPYFCFKI